MTIAAIGVNFKTAPIDVREKITFHEAIIPQSLDVIYALPGIEEAVILSTCHRSELYLFGKELSRKNEPIIDYLKQVFSIKEEECLPYLYRYHEEQAARHLFNVASGIDSMILGEQQILGQVKRALYIAEKHGTAGAILNRLFQSAIKVGKRGRHESALGENSGSVGHAAVLLAKRIFSTLEERTALVIGAGDMGRLTAKVLFKEGLKNVLVTSRNPLRAETLAKEFNGTAIPFEERFQHLWRTDIVISSTSAPHYVLCADSIKQAIRERRNTPMFLIDLAMPRDIDPKANQIENVYLYDLDDLEETVTQENKEREQAVKEVKQFIEEELASFFSWYNSLGAVPVIQALRNHLEEIRQEEIHKFLIKFPHLSNKERTALEALTKGIINKMVHHPLIQLKEYAQEPDGLKYLETIKALFGLNTFSYKEQDINGQLWG